MLSDQLFRVLPYAAAVVLLGAASTAFAASSTSRPPLILDTQSGISDGQSGTTLQTAPLSKKHIVEAQPIASPEELPVNNGGQPYIVAPYIQVPGGGSAYPQPQPQPQPQPRPRPLPVRPVPAP
jgi:streptogramin lyase